MSNKVNYDIIDEMKRKIKNKNKEYMWAFALCIFIYKQKKHNGIFYLTPQGSNKNVKKEL